MKHRLGISAPAWPADVKSLRAGRNCTDLMDIDSGKPEVEPVDRKKITNPVSWPGNPGC